MGISYRKAHGSLVRVPSIPYAADAIFLIRLYEAWCAADDKVWVIEGRYKARAGVLLWKG